MRLLGRTLIVVPCWWNKNTDRYGTQQKHFLTIFCSLAATVNQIRPDLLPEYGNVFEHFLIIVLIFFIAGNRKDVEPIPQSPPSGFFNSVLHNLQLNTTNSVNPNQHNQVSYT